jgi:hypothetical protein
MRRLDARGHDVSLTPEDEQALTRMRREWGRRMDDLRCERGLAPKELYAALGWDKSAYSRKYRGGAKIEDDEVIILRRVLDAPAPWPYVSLEEALLLAAFPGRAAEVFTHLTEILALLDRHRRMPSEDQASAPSPDVPAVVRER